MTLDDALRLAHLRCQLPRPEELRRRRRAAGISMNVVAAELGVSAVAVLQWEKGRRIPRDPAVLARYWALLGIKVK